MSIGDNLKRLREKKGVSQTDLSKELNITRSMLCQIERGTKTLSLPLAKEITQVLNCGIDELFEE